MQRYEAFRFKGGSIDECVARAQGNFTKLARSGDSSLLYFRHEQDGGTTILVHPGIIMLKVKQPGTETGAVLYAAPGMNTQLENLPLPTLQEILGGCGSGALGPQARDSIVTALGKVHDVMYKKYEKSRDACKAFDKVMELFSPAGQSCVRWSIRAILLPISIGGYVRYLQTMKTIAKDSILDTAQVVVNNGVCKKAVDIGIEWGQERMNASTGQQRETLGQALEQDARISAAHARLMQVGGNIWKYDNAIFTHLYGHNVILAGSG